MKLAGLAVLLSVVMGALSAQTMDEAAALLQKSDWAGAEAALAAITGREPGNGPAWQGLGLARLQQHKDSLAVAAYEKAIAAGAQPLRNYVNIARAKADAKDLPGVLAALQKIVDTGRAPLVRGYVLLAPELAAYHADPRFQAVFAHFAACQEPEFHQFDFWVGDWNVTAPQGAPVGHNRITREQDGCLLVEHWDSTPPGQTGTSFNYYDINDKKWHQLYISNSGNAGGFPPMAGTLVDGKMVLITDETKSPVFRWTWYEISPGKVRQMAEQSTDGEKTWTITWDSIYEKAK